MKNLDYDLLICGTGPLEDNIRELVKVSKNIKLLGQVEHTELMKLLSGAKALLFTSVIYEAFPLSIVEAFSQGIPVITNNVGNGSQLITEGITGLKYDRDNLHSFKTTIDKILDLNLKENVLKEYKGKYTEDKNYKLLADIYKEIIRN